MSTQPESGLISRAIARPVSVAAILILAVFFGVLSIFRLPIQLTPDITQPTIAVTTLWPGAAPIEVESELLEPQEEVLKRVPGLLTMESVARSSSGEITLEFKVGTNLEQALVRVTNQLSQVPRYPESAEQPIVSTANAAGPPLAVLLVKHLDGKTVDPYRTWVEEEIVPILERIPGIASTFIRGGRVSELQIDFDTGALAARGLTIPSIAAQLRGQLRHLSAGELEIGKRTILTRTLTAAPHVEDLEQFVVKTDPQGGVVRLRDVASVHLGLRRADGFAIGNDRESIALLPRREAGSNVLELTQRIHAEVERLNRERFAPEGLLLEVVDDQSGYIYEALEQVRNNLLLGAVLATLILLLFLRSLAASLIVALAIPLCVTVTALGMALIGRSVNVVSLAGITFAVGMVVDNSIVALENIDTWRARVATPREAAYHGIVEVWGALLASTATTAAVFIPIMTWQGQVGELLRDIAYAIALSVSISLLVAVLAIPSFAARVLRPKAEPETSERAPDRRAFLSPIRAAAVFRDRVTQLTTWVAVSRFRALSAVALGLGLSALVVIAWLPKMEYLPTGNRNLIFGIVLPPPGASVPELKKIGFENQAEMMAHTHRRVDGVPSVQRSFFVGTPGLLFVGGVAEDPDEVLALRDYMRTLHARIPGAIAFASQAALFARGIGEGRAVRVELKGADLRTLVQVSRRLFGELRTVVSGAQVRPDPVLDFGAPEFHVLPRRDELARVGLTPLDLGLITDSYVDGTILGEFGEEGRRKLDIVLRNAETDAAFDDGSLLTAPVALPNGEVVPFSVLADIKEELGPTVIKRLERDRAMVLQVTPPDDTPLEVAIEKIGAHLDKLQKEGAIPANITVELGGSAGDLAAAQKQFAGILAIALLILYLLLAALYEDFLAPLVVLTTVPLAAAGGVLGLKLFELVLEPQPFDLMAALGFLILFGIVVNNAILIIDGALARLRAGEALEVATGEAVRARIRPIFMSTLTSLAGLLPMVLSDGSGSELYRGVGTIVLGGLTVSTLLSLLVVPSGFVLLRRLTHKTQAALDPTMASS